MDAPLPCLTIIQPWATLVALGVKRVETRDWTRPGLAGRRVAVHAAARWTPAQAAFASHPAVAAVLAAAGFRASADPRAPGMLPLGAVLATVRVVGFAEYAALDPASWRAVAAAAMGDHGHGRYAWVLADAEALPSPVPARGERGLWAWRGTPPA